MRKRVGIITFHASYNCGSMLQAYALQYFLKKRGYQPEIIDFSSQGQRELYAVYSKNKSFKLFLRNCILFLHRSRIFENNLRYETFKKEHFPLTSYSTADSHKLEDNYDAVIAGADQIWNVTIADYDDAYFLPWVKSARRIAYAPSFGARNVAEYAKDLQMIGKYLNDFDYLSIRENNGQKWIEDLIGKTVPVVLDPTLLITAEDYNDIVSDELRLPEKYIFYYAPSYSLRINKLVKKISEKYKLPVIAFNSKSFYLRAMDVSGFKLPDVEDPSIYLQLMKHAEMVITTSFHGTIFASIFKRNFWVIKNGGMFTTDDRVLTLLQQLAIEDRLISDEFDEMFDYRAAADYERYHVNLKNLRNFSQNYLLSALEGLK